VIHKYNIFSHFYPFFPTSLTNVVIQPWNKGQVAASRTLNLEYPKFCNLWCCISFV